MKNSHCFFQNTDCEYFPCHKVTDCSNFSCLFCYCPLYALGEQCGGNYTYTQDGVKDCSACMLPHDAKGYDYVISQFPKVAELAKKKER